ncbi:hypothetical protein VKT23_016256 [Stygiomarasmius scandens]|uniref:Uncharacterized protein n=1 Tax=Marasmiellus scandens TaxID=2682957 RepID=A0ABR1IY53_9AGAR
MHCAQLRFLVSLKLSDTLNVVCNGLNVVKVTHICRRRCTPASNTLNADWHGP